MTITNTSLAQAIDDINLFVLTHYWQDEGYLVAFNKINTALSDKYKNHGNKYIEDALTIMVAENYLKCELGDRGGYIRQGDEYIFEYNQFFGHTDKGLILHNNGGLLKQVKKDKMNRLFKIWGPIIGGIITVIGIWLAYIKNEDGNLAKQNTNPTSLDSTHRKEPTDTLNHTTNQKESAASKTTR